MKKFLVLVLFSTLTLGVVGAQQLVKTGIVNLTRINQAYKDAKTKHLEDLKVAAQKELDRMKDEIRLLGDQRTDAVGKGDSVKVQTLDTDIQAKKTAFADFGKRKQEEIASAAEALKNDSTLQKLLPTEIENAARSMGFALVLSASNTVVLWYGPDADITDDVINRLAVDTGLPLVTKAVPSN